MTASVFDLFKPGVGPSSSHTMGPMTAAARFVGELRTGGLIAGVTRVQVKLYASLALTGRGQSAPQGQQGGIEQGQHTGFAVKLGHPLTGIVETRSLPEGGHAARHVLRDTREQTPFPSNHHPTAH